MSIFDRDLFSGLNKVETALERIRTFCASPKRVLIAFSGGKDSQVCYHLCEEIWRERERERERFTAQYSVTRFEPPELISFIREHYPDVVWRRAYKKDLIHDIELHGLPNRWTRWCCQSKHLKTEGYDITIIGIRAFESAKRRDTWRMFGTKPNGENCLCPIIDWTDKDVWEYLDSRKIEHCKLYDEGYDRIGCVMCPLISQSKRKKDLIRYPKTVAMLRKGANMYVERMRKQGFTTKTGKPCTDWCKAVSPEDEFWNRWAYTGQTAKNVKEMSGEDDSDQQCLFAGSGFSETDGLGEEEWD